MASFNVLGSRRRSWNTQTVLLFVYSAVVTCALVLVVSKNFETPEQIVAEEQMAAAEKDTVEFTRMTVVLAINYGGRDEMLRAFQKLAAQGTAATETSVPAAFDIPELPDADLIIRTGGEKRLSNFLLWHSAYAELIFSETLWPDYTNEEFYADIAEYQSRNRRFGGVK